jgi:hypothetical protein
MCESLQNFLLRFTDGWLRIMGHEVFLKQILVIAAQRLKQKPQLYPQKCITSYHRNMTGILLEILGNSVANNVFHHRKQNTHGPLFIKIIHCIVISFFIITLRFFIYFLNRMIISAYAYVIWTKHRNTKSGNRIASQELTNHLTLTLRASW